jgi:hypothetical protein
MAPIVGASDHFNAFPMMIRSHDEEPYLGKSMPTNLNVPFSEAPSKLGHAKSTECPNRDHSQWPSHLSRKPFSVGRESIGNVSTGKK